MANEYKKKQEKLDNHGANYLDVSNSNLGHFFITWNVKQERFKDIYGF